MNVRDTNRLFKKMREAANSVPGKLETLAEEFDVSERAVDNRLAAGQQPLHKLGLVDAMVILGLAQPAERQAVLAELVNHFGDSYAPGPPVVPTVDDLRDGALDVGALAGRFQQLIRDALADGKLTWEEIETLKAAGHGLTDATHAEMRAAESMEAGPGPSNVTLFPKPIKGAGKK